jgi:CubicO group peptidase (beta-lactamase class C family)
MKNTLLTLLIPVLIQSCTPTPVPKHDELADKIKRVETSLSKPVYIEGDSTWTMEERMAHYGVPGVSLAVIHEGKIAWTKTYGVMDKESKTPVTKNTLFQAGSISKPVAAYGALRLVESNKIDLDEQVNTYLKSWKLPDNEFSQEKHVTLKNLLNHSAGVTVHGFLGYSPDLPVPTLVEVLNGTPPSNSGAIFVNKTPEESFRYSGGGYTIMQQMLIDVEGKSFPALMDEQVLQPLEMNNSTYDQPLQGQQLENAATGYLPDGSMTKGKRHTYPEMAAAGLWTTAEDLARFAVNIQKTLNGESKIALSQAMTTKMLTPFVEEFTGLGIFINKMKEEIYFGHGGWDEGFSSELIAHKDKGYGVVVLTNSNHPAFISELIRSVALTYSWADFVPSYKKMLVSDSLVDQISGRYSVDGNRLVEVYQSENLLFSKEIGKEPTELIRISDSTYIRRERNQIIQFSADSINKQFNMQMLNPNDGAIESTYLRMTTDEKIPMELLEAGNFDQALLAYQALLRQDSKNPAVNENNLNGTGYGYLNDGNTKLAKAIFKINTLLYPNSANTYDSYAEACMRNGDTELALENYKESLRLNPQNGNATEMIKELEK